MPFPSFFRIFTFLVLLGFPFYFFLSFFPGFEGTVSEYNGFWWSENASVDWQENFSGFENSTVFGKSGSYHLIGPVSAEELFLAVELTPKNCSSSARLSLATDAIIKEAWWNGVPIENASSLKSASLEPACGKNHLNIHLLRRNSTGTPQERFFLVRGHSEQIGGVELESSDLNMNKLRDHAVNLSFYTVDHPFHIYNAMQLQTFLQGGGIKSIYIYDWPFLQYPPSIHLFPALFLIVSGFPITSSYLVFVLLLSLLPPFIFYFILKKSGFALASLISFVWYFIPFSIENAINGGLVSYLQAGFIAYLSSSLFFLFALYFLSLHVSSRNRWHFFFSLFFLFLALFSNARIIFFFPLVPIVFFFSSHDLKKSVFLGVLVAVLCFGPLATYFYNFSSSTYYESVFYIDSIPDGVQALFFAAPFEFFLMLAASLFYLKSKNPALKMFSLFLLFSFILLVLPLQLFVKGFEQQRLYPTFFYAGIPLVACFLAEVFERARKLPLAFVLVFSFLLLLVFLFLAVIANALLFEVKSEVFGAKTLGEHVVFEKILPQLQGKVLMVGYYSTQHIPQVYALSDASMLIYEWPKELSVNDSFKLKERGFSSVVFKRFHHENFSWMEEWNGDKIFSSQILNAHSFNNSLVASDSEKCKFESKVMQAKMTLDFEDELCNVTIKRRFFRDWVVEGGKVFETPEGFIGVTPFEKRVSLDFRVSNVELFAWAASVLACFVPFLPVFRKFY